MKRIILIIVLLLISGLSFSFAYFKTQAQGSEDNYFNLNLREKFAAYPMLRQALGLHFDGDGKADYLGDRYKKILIEVDVMDNLAVRIAGLDLLARRIQEITGKETSYVISDQKILYERDMAPARTGAIVSRYRNRRNTGDTASLYFLYASRAEGEPNLLGLTQDEYGLVLFGEAVQSFTEEDIADTLASYEASTALHEFGHQLGLSHNDQPGCLMNERADRAQSRIEKPGDVITDFCNFEKDLIGR